MGKDHLLATLLGSRIGMEDLSTGRVLSMTNRKGENQVLIPRSKEDYYDVRGLQMEGIIVHSYEDDPASAMSPEDIRDSAQEILSALASLTGSYSFLLAGCGLYIQLVDTQQDPQEVAHLAGELLTTAGFPGVPVTVQDGTGTVVTALAGTFADAPQGITAEAIQEITDLLESSTSVEDFLKRI